MFIRKALFKNFKRFTNLTIDLSNLASDPKLVLLIGANGSGKTCVFDAFEWVSSVQKDGSQQDFVYYQKSKQEPTEIRIEFDEGLIFHRKDGQLLQRVERRDLFYGRSALRQTPQLTRTRLGDGVDIAADVDRPRRYIQRDERFENDIENIAGDIFRDVFNGKEFDSERLQAHYIQPLNDALARIFGTPEIGGVALHAFIPPISRKVADIRFRKGKSEFHYDLLSSGEKEVFNLLLNLFTRRKFYENSIYFLDELDVHLNTALQQTLLNEIVEHWIPNHCQLWTASHSLGFIDYARQSQQAVTLDFDQLDFDLPHQVIAQPKESLEVYEIAVPKQVLSSIFRDKQLTFCENRDVELYNLLNLPTRLFLPAKDKNDVYFAVTHNPACFGLIDRDFLTPHEIAQIRQKVPNLYPLRYYSIENYLYHPANLQEVLPDFDQAGYLAYLQEQKKRLRDEIIYGLQNARNGYKVLASEKIEDKNAFRVICEAIDSDSFEEYYPYLAMKKGKIDHSVLEKLNLSKSLLAQTAWFRQAIAACFIE